MQIKNIDGIVIKVRYSLAVERARNFPYLASVFQTYLYPWYIYLISERLSHPSYWQRSIWPSAAYPEGPLMGLKCVWRTLRISNHIFTPGCMLHLIIPSTQHMLLSFQLWPKPILITRKLPPNSPCTFIISCDSVSYVCRQLCRSRDHTSKSPALM